MAYFLLGRILNFLKKTEAFEYLQQAKQCFQVLADNGSQAASQMVAASLCGQGDTLREQGKLEFAAELYQQAIALDEKYNAIRGITVGKGQLATIRFLQKDYDSALKIYIEINDLFQLFNEPQGFATNLYRIGMVYRTMQKFEKSEQAHRQSLALRVKHEFISDEAESLGELGNLYTDWEKHEEAVVFYQKAINICDQLKNNLYKSLIQDNIARNLIKLQRYDEARTELQRAIECKKEFGHSATPWTTWDILCDLETACNNPKAAQAAKQQAITSYLAYRRDGGENMSGSQVPQLCQAVLQAIRENQTDELLKDLTGFQNLSGLEQLPDYLKPVIPKLIAILQGNRNPTLANDPELDYDDAAELLLLLEQLS